MARVKQAKPKAKAKRAPRRRIRSALAAVPRFLARLVLGLAWRLVLAAGVIVAAATAYSYVTLPEMTALLDGRERGSVILTDRGGEVFAWRGDQYGGDLRASAASPHLVNAVVATEDKRFHLHPGLDPIGMARAMLANWQAGRVVQGGSTLTQQVAKLLFFDHTRSLERHIRQVPVVLAMELKYTKADILSIYLNRVYLGAGTHGFEAAARRYFGKSAREVDIPEAAMLAGLLKAPSRYAPTSDLGRAQDRAALVIRLMRDQGYISETDAAVALARPAVLSEAAAARAGGYFADWVMTEAPDYLTSETSEDVEIRTTFDPAVQGAAEAALARVFEEKVRPGSKAEAAIVVLSPDGAVRAIVGGRGAGDAAPGQFNRATQALRQTGSSFKPFVYGAALELGFPPDATVLDAPITLEVPGSADWTPKNYTGEYFGRVTLTDALANSLNTAAVRVAEEVGPARIRAMAQDFGITSPLAPGPAFVLGTSEATLLEMTGAYAGILNGGRRAVPYGLTELRLRGDTVPLLEGQRDFGTRVLGEEAAAGLIWMMHQVIEAGSGQRARLPGREAAGKTGTTQGARDAWFIGFTAHYAVGVWMGYDDNSPLTGVTGGGLPAEIWRETMLAIHEGLPPRALPMRAPAPARVAQNETAPPAGTAPRAEEPLVRRVLDALFGR